VLIVLGLVCFKLWCGWDAELWRWWGVRTAWWFDCGLAVLDRVRWGCILMFPALMARVGVAIWRKRWTNRAKLRS